MSRNSALLALLAAGLIAGTVPALANSDANAEAAVAAMPHSAPVSNGTPVQIGTDQGKPRFAYTGEGSGNLSAGIPHVVGSDAGGEPVITYAP
jgi:hypothetical protein